MSFLITRRPEKLFSGSLKFSRWTAVNNPYIFEFQRADFTVINTRVRTAYHALKPTIYTTADPITLPAFVFAGDEIYLNSGMYQGTYTVFSVSGQYITIDTPNAGNGGAGYVNLVGRLQNYTAFIKIYHGVTNVLIDTVYPKPDSKGLLLCDVSGVIRSTIVTSLTTVQSTINKANKGISGGFKIGYGATYRAVLPSIIVPVTIPEVPSSPIGNTQLYYWVSAARQISGATPLTIGGIGQNMKEHVPKNLNGSAAKFLTMFEKPTYFEGFPFFLSFIYDADFSTVYLERHQQDVDINGANVGAETDTKLNVSERGYVNTVKVRAINSGSAGFDFWLETGDTIEDGYVLSGGIKLGAAGVFANSLNG